MGGILQRRGCWLKKNAEKIKTEKKHQQNVAARQQKYAKIYTVQQNEVLVFKICVQLDKYRRFVEQIEVVDYLLENNPLTKTSKTSP